MSDLAPAESALDKVPEAFARVFDVSVAMDQPCVFVEPGVIEELRAMTVPTAT